MDEDQAFDRTSPTWSGYPESVQRDIAAYQRFPPTEEERALGYLPVRLDLGEDGTRGMTMTTTDQWADLYRDLHTHPELSFQETRTAGIVAERLTALGFAVI